MKLGLPRGIGMIAIATVWFVLGLINGYIYFYPFILFAIGAYTLFKGMQKKDVIPACGYWVLARAF
ncbi:MAG: hypothetical protein SH819_15065 [Cytophagales bacterium]|nr:hypothetical protein [Cytophagales bacterium]